MHSCLPLSAPSLSAPLAALWGLGPRTRPASHWGSCCPESAPCPGTGARSLPAGTFSSRGSARCFFRNLKHRDSYKDSQHVQYSVVSVVRFARCYRVWVVEVRCRVSLQPRCVYSTDSCVSSCSYSHPSAPPSPAAAPGWLDLLTPAFGVPDDTFKCCRKNNTSMQKEPRASS